MTQKLKGSRAQPPKAIGGPILQIVAQALPLAIAFRQAERLPYNFFVVVDLLGGSSAEDRRYRAVVSSKSPPRSWAVSILMMKLCNFLH